MSRSLVFALGVAIGLLAAYLVWGDRIAEHRTAEKSEPSWEWWAPQSNERMTWRDLELVDSV